MLSLQQLTGARAPVRPSPVERGIWLALFAGILLWSGIAPHDALTWCLEVAPALLGLLTLALLWRSFAFTRLTSWFILVHAVILMIGGHYTYAEVPWFNWLRDTFDLTRNHYDRVGHFAQGFVPALIAREVLLRQTLLARGALLSLLVVAVCLAISALYEILEWQVAVWTGSAATAFLGTQGDVWDTQYDMFFALLGALTAILLMAKWQDRQLTEAEAEAEAEVGQVVAQESRTGKQ